MLNLGKARNLASALGNLKVSPTLTDRDIVKVREVVVRNMSFSQALELDAAPGIVGYSVNGKEWHWKLRQTRNRGGLDRGWKPTPKRARKVAAEVAS